MELVLLPQAQADRDYWKKVGNQAVMKRITALLEDIMEHPFTGLGKPEPLKHELQGKWSRRINLSTLCRMARYMFTYFLCVIIIDTTLFPPFSIFTPRF